MKKLLMNAGIMFAGILMGYAFFLTIVWFKPSSIAIADAETGTGQDFASIIEIQEAFRLISAQVLPSIVEVTVEKKIEDKDDKEQPWNQFFQDPSKESDEPQYYRSNGLGSGIIIEGKKDAYYIVTNAHVIGESESAKLKFFDGSTREAHVVGSDERKDLTVLEFDPEDRIYPVIKIGDSDSLYRGDWVLAFGSPFGYEHSVSSGIVSALKRKIGPKNNISEFIQTDASINQGNSGGALVNIHGELVGVNTFITTPNRGSIGLGFAIPVNNIKSSFHQIINKGKASYGWLGVSLGPYGKETALSLGYSKDKGVMVYQVYKNSPAERAGLRPGDLILSLDNEDKTDTHELIYRIGDKRPGENAILYVDRFGRKIKIKAILKEREPELELRTMHDQIEPGFLVSPFLRELKEKMNNDFEGVAVAEVYPRTSAQAIGLKPGDIITAVNKQKISSMREFYIEISKLPYNKNHFTVYRDEETLILGFDVQREILNGDQ